MWVAVGRKTIFFAIIPLLAGCGTVSQSLGVVGHVADSAGGAVADEPTAALVARDILSAGGNAADAAVALYFALAVTYPVAAGIGGGGACVAYDARGNRPGTTGFAVIDRAGGAVACRLSMNGAFGTGRILPGIGAFAAAPGPGIEGASIAVVSNANARNTFFAAAASGGPASAAARSRTVYAEAGLADTAAPRRGRGFRIVSGGSLGRVNAIHCPGGSRSGRDSCRYGADPRGFGHAVSAAR